MFRESRLAGRQDQQGSADHATQQYVCRTGDSEAVHDVSSEAEGHLLRMGQQAPLVKGNSQINVNHLSAAPVDQYVIEVAIAQANDESCH